MTLGTTLPLKLLDVYTLVLMVHSTISVGTGAMSNTTSHSNNSFHSCTTLTLDASNDVLVNASYAFEVLSHRADIDEVDVNERPHAVFVKEEVGG